MAMTLLSMRNYVRVWMKSAYSANKMTEGKQFSLTDSEIDAEINMVYLPFASYVKVRSTPSLLTTTEDTETYTTPSTLFSIDAVLYTSSVDSWRLKRLESVEERLYAMTLLDGDPYFYETRYQTNEITLYPAPQEDGETITIYGTLYVTDLSADTDSPLIPANFHPALCDMVIERLIIQAGMYDPARTSASALFEKLSNTIAQKAKACKAQYQKTNDNQGFTDSQYTCDKYGVPVPNHNPVVSQLRYLGDLTFKNYDTDCLAMMLDGDGVYFYDPDDESDLFAVTSTAITWLGTAIFGRIEATPDSDDYDYTYTGTKGSTYDLTVYAANALGTANVCATYQVVHHTATFAPDVTLLSYQANGTPVIAITLSVTIASASIGINITNADAGSVTIGTRNGMTL